MTKRQYIDKAYDTMHELLTLYRECFPEEAAAGGISVYFGGENTIAMFPDVSHVSIHVFSQNDSVDRTLEVSVDESSKRYYENYEVI